MDNLPAPPSPPEPPQAPVPARPRLHPDVDPVARLVPLVPTFADGTTLHWKLDDRVVVSVELEHYRDHTAWRTAVLDLTGRLVHSTPHRTHRAAAATVRKALRSWGLIP